MLEGTPYEEGKHAYNEIKDLNVKEGSYQMQGIFTFKTDKGYLVLSAEDAIEIAVALFDWAGMSYDPIEDIADRRAKGEL